MLRKDQVESLYDCISRPDLLSFMEYGQVFHNTANPDQKYIYCPTPGAKVLAVAHTDWVGQTQGKGYSWKNEAVIEPQISLDYKFVRARQLDDRLGVWIILHLLKELLPPTMPYDILLTDMEECGQSTASFFLPPEGVSYNWMFEWDRHGDDVVMYDYETRPLKKLLTDYEFKVGKGSFTDIGYLSHLKIAGFNFGCAYYGEHSNECTADLDTLMSQIDLFLPFYVDNYSTLMKSKHSSSRSKIDSPKGLHHNFRYFQTYQDDLFTEDEYQRKRTRQGEELDTVLFRDGIDDIDDKRLLILHADSAPVGMGFEEWKRRYLQIRGQSTPPLDDASIEDQIWKEHFRSRSVKKQKK